MPGLHRLLLLLLALCVPIGSAVAQEQGGARAARASRSDLGWAYLRYERTFFSAPREDEQCARLNREFDLASLAFFGGSLTEVVRQLNASLAPIVSGDHGGWWPVAASLRVRLDQPCITNDGTVTARVESLYPTPAPPGAAAPGPLELSFRSRFAAREEVGIVFSAPIPVQIDNGQATVDAVLSLETHFSKMVGRTRGLYDVVISVPGVAPVQVGVFHVLERPLDDIRTDNEKATAAVPESAELRRARAIFLARNEQLRPQADTGAVVTDLWELTQALDAERRAILAGRDPYHGHLGDLWRPVGVGESGEENGTPARVFAPSAAKNDKPLPLLIAVHGAGADEHMFFDGYGGELKDLAEKHTMLVVSPRAGPFAGTPKLLDAIIADIARDFPVDPARIYLVGHSMGGGIVSAWVKQRPSRIAAACTIAGVGGFSKDAKLPPVLVIAAALDGIVPASRVKRSAQAAIDAGLPVTFREMEHYGHTLVVGRVLPDVVPWLAERRSPH